MSECLLFNANSEQLNQLYQCEKRMSECLLFNAHSEQLNQLYQCENK